MSDGNIFLYVCVFLYIVCEKLLVIVDNSARFAKTNAKLGIKPQYNLKLLWVCVTIDDVESNK
jgi:hypothetical protein